MQDIVYTTDVAAAVGAIVRELSPSGMLAIVDSDVMSLHGGRLAPIVGSMPCVTVRVDSEKAKSLDGAVALWRAMAREGITRRSLILNIGGGVVTDMGGFAAATFKRGVPFVNIPTTVLGAVDAATGGKTGIDFDGLKNEVGVFREAVGVIVDPGFFGTLPREELLSGFGEMIKHALLLKRSSLASLLSAGPGRIGIDNIRESVEVKRRIVAADPLERGMRRALNLGHTAGHAFESLALERDMPVSHGRAVAWGLVTALVLSRMLEGFPGDVLHTVAIEVKGLYGTVPFSCEDYDALLGFMAHDKKNDSAGRIAFTLLRDFADPVTGRVVGRDDIAAALDITRDLLG